MYAPDEFLGESMNRIAHYLQERDDPSTPTEIAEHLDIPRPIVNVYLTRLISRKEIIRIHRGQYITNATRKA